MTRLRLTLLAWLVVVAALVPSHGYFSHYALSCNPSNTVCVERGMDSLGKLVPGATTILVWTGERWAP
jgi:hypothetical protein